MKHQDANNKSADGSDAGPDGVGCPHRDALLCKPQEVAAERHGYNGKENPPEFSGGLRLGEFESEGPADLETTCDKKKDPCHGFVFWVNVQKNPLRDDIIA